MGDRRRLAILSLLAVALAACSGTPSQGTEAAPAAPSASAGDAQAPTASGGDACDGGASGKGVPADVIALMGALPDYPAEMKALHALAEAMHESAAECAGFASQEHAELAKFDELSAERADSQRAQCELGPLMTEVAQAVMPKLVDALKACREAQIGTAEDTALAALMLACFGQTRADYPVTSAGGSTAYGDPLRMPPLSQFKPSASCSAAAVSARAVIPSH